MHAVKALWAGHHPPSGYPTGVMPVPEPIAGTAFFPGGFGIWNTKVDRPLPPMPIGGVMVLGHDFHSEAGYRLSFEQGGERFTLPTWNSLLKSLDGARIDLAQCFFTNFYMGLRIGKATTGRFPGAGDAAFLKHCQAFFLEQLRVQEPGLIIVLGSNVPPLISDLSSSLTAWRKRGFRHIDATGPVKADVRFTDYPEHTTTIVSLVHPSFRHASVKHRRYCGLVGDAAESAMLRDAFDASRCR